MARLFLENGVSFARESTLTSHFDFTLMSEAKKKGYSIELVYIGLESSDLAWARVASRAARGGHSVPYEDVIRRFVRSLENLPKAIALADKATILDNSTQGYRLIQAAGQPSIHRENIIPVSLRRGGIFFFEPQKENIMESQTIQELEASRQRKWMPDLFSAECRLAIPYGATRILACIHLPSTRITVFTNRHGMPPSGS